MVSEGYLSDLLFSDKLNVLFLGNMIWTLVTKALLNELEVQSKGWKEYNSLQDQFGFLFSRGFMIQRRAFLQHDGLSFGME